MKITDIFKQDKPTLSFEVFPPKTSDKFDSVKYATEEIAKLAPSYMSVTYGAGGGTSDFTVAIAENLKKSFGVTPVAHLTCVSSDKARVSAQLEAMKKAGIDNVLALRGDIPADAPDKSTWAYHYASELVADIKAAGDFCIGGACYPEVHPESANQAEDLKHLKEKVDCGCDYLVTQLFFDNNIFYNFLYKAREAGITCPIVPGIMPITRAVQLKRSMSMSGTHVPMRFSQIVDMFGDDSDSMMEAGIAYATEQIVDLYANGIHYAHVYSMNNPEVARRIQENLSHIIGKK